MNIANEYRRKIHQLLFPMSLREFVFFRGDSSHDFISALRVVALFF